MEQDASCSQSLSVKPSVMQTQVGSDSNQVVQAVMRPPSWQPPKFEPDNSPSPAVEAPVVMFTADLPARQCNSHSSPVTECCTIILLGAPQQPGTSDPQCDRDTCSVRPQIFFQKTQVQQHNKEHLAMWPCFGIIIAVGLSNIC